MVVGVFWGTDDDKEVDDDEENKGDEEVALLWRGLLVCRWYCWFWLSLSIAFLLNLYAEKDDSFIKLFDLFECF